MSASGIDWARVRRWDRATRYAVCVRAGVIPAGPSVRLAARRHLRDVIASTRPGAAWQWSPSRAHRAINFFPALLSHPGADGALHPFRLLPWQAFVVGSLFGWLDRADSTRRFRRAYIETSKGSGKTPLAAGLALYFLCAERAPRTECYLGATTAEQALVTMRDVIAFIDNNTLLSTKLSIYGGRVKPERIDARASGSFLKRVTADEKGRGLSGIRPTFVLLDEYHEAGNSTVHDLLFGGFKNSRQPLGLITTNAGESLQSPCGEAHVRAHKVLRDLESGAREFVFLADLDRDDHPFDDPACWPKVAPSLPTIPGEKYIRDQIAAASTGPSARAIVNRLQFCVWGESLAPWLDPERWRACEVPALTAARRDWPCWAALDLSSVRDLSSLALVWSPPDPAAPLEAEVLSWIPDHNLRARCETERVPYDSWIDAGHLRAIPGRVIDMRVIADALASAIAENQMHALAFDKWRFEQVRQALDDAGIVYGDTARDAGLTLLAHPQGFQPASARADGLPGLSMPTSINALERTALSGALRVARNPPLRAAVSGARVVADAAGNRRPMKNKSLTRIDPAVALIMAVGLADAARAHAVSDPRPGLPPPEWYQ